MIKENIDADFNNYKMCGTFPIPKQPVPASLRGFNRIYILHIDHNVIAFLHRIRCLFNGGIGLSLGIWPEVPSKSMLECVWPRDLASAVALYQLIQHLQNAQTREQLTLQHHLAAFSIKRGPILGDKKQWDGWLLEAGYERWVRLNNMITIEISDANIG
ncbi:hypothetical protein GPALN_003024 [Globodera pallida]|nr:hypothetical protein GPALN_003024 [Globodera pallida]